MIKSADSFEAFVAGVSRVTGLPRDVVARSLPAQNWREFQANAEKYVDLLIDGLRAAYEKRKWSKGYRAAFSH